MGLSLKKITKKIGKVATKATKAVSNPIKQIAAGTGKVIGGDVKGGLGDIGAAGTRMGLDIATAGNRKTADALSGGALTAAEGASRGNTADIARLAVTGGAAFVGGPAGGMAANQFFASGNLTTQNALASGAQIALGSDSMSWLGDIKEKTGFDVGGLLSQVVDSQLNPKKDKGDPGLVAGPQQPVFVQAPSDNKMIYIAGGVAVLGLFAVLLLRKR